MCNRRTGRSKVVQPLFLQRVEGLVVLFVALDDGHQIKFLIDSRAAVHQVGADARFYVFHLELGLRLPVLGLAVVVTHQSGGRGWRQRGRFLEGPGQIPV